MDLSKQDRWTDNPEILWNWNCFEENCQKVAEHLNLTFFKTFRCWDQSSHEQPIARHVIIGNCRLGNGQADQNQTIRPQDCWETTVQGLSFCLQFLCWGGTFTTKNPPGHTSLLLRHAGWDASTSCEEAGYTLRLEYIYCISPLSEQVIISKHHSYDIIPWVAGRLRVLACHYIFNTWLDNKSSDVHIVYSLSVCWSGGCP